MTQIAIETRTSTVNVTNYWTLYFRHGMNSTLSKNFYFEGSLMEAAKRGQEHCKIMGYHYIWVRPLVCNIEAEEDYKLKGNLSSCPPGEL